MTQIVENVHNTCLAAALGIANYCSLKLNCMEKRLHNLKNLNGGLCNHFALYQCKMILQSTIKIIHHSSFSNCVTAFT